MSDERAIRSSLHDAEEAVLPWVRPPGTGAVARRLRRRRATRAGVSGAAAVVALAAVLIGPWNDRPDHGLPAGPVADVTTTPTTADPSSGGSSKVGAVAPGVAPGDDGPQHPCEPDGTMAAAQTAAGTVTVSTTGTWCPGDSATITWARYVWQPDGQLAIAGSGLATVGTAAARTTLPVGVDECTGLIVVIAGSVAPPAAVAADTPPASVLPARGSVTGTTLLLTQTAPAPQCLPSPEPSTSASPTAAAMLPPSASPSA